MRDRSFRNGARAPGGMSRRPIAITPPALALMGLAASYIARLLQRYRWIAYVGLAIILYVSLKMIYEGFMEIYPLMNGVTG